MTNKHYFAYYIQFALMAVLGVSVNYLPLGIYTIVVVLFFISEIYLLEQGRKMDPVKIRYRKSLLFGLLDFCAVITFLLYLLVFCLKIGCIESSLFWGFLSKIEDLPLKYFNILIWYTFVRKFYIYKNLTYEK